jgi:hypothetical protein
MRCGEVENWVGLGGIGKYRKENGEEEGGGAWMWGGGRGKKERIRGGLDPPLFRP